MRYYDIQIFSPADGDKPEKLIKQYSSHKNGVYNPGALMIEFDILRFGESTPQGETHLVVWGIGPKEMQQARQELFGKKIKVLWERDFHLLARSQHQNLSCREPSTRYSATGRVQN